MPVTFLRRKRGTPNQIGKPFPVEEPQGRKQDLPRAVKQVSFDEIPEFIKKQRDKGKTPEEKDEDEMIEETIEQEMREERENERKKNILQKLGNMVEKEQKRRRLRKALEEAKEEQKDHESESGDGYAEREIYRNDVMGNG